MAQIVTVIEPPRSVATVVQAGQGPAGPRGLPGVGAATTVPAAQSLGGHRAVVVDAFEKADYADANNLAHFGRVAGITTAASATGEPVIVQASGPITEGSWSWIPNADVWVASNGLLTQTLPAGAAFLQRIGVAISATRLWLNLSEPVLT
jgi:hypothetical protein